MWFDIATISVVVLTSILSVAANYWMTRSRIRKVNDLLNNHAVRLGEHESKMAERHAVNEALLVSIENYTRKNRHNVTNLVDAITLLFPEIKTKLQAKGTTVSPADLEEK